MPYIRFAIAKLFVSFLDDLLRISYQPDIAGHSREATRLGQLHTL
jgi:hypothetical protein